MVEQNQQLHPGNLIHVGNWRWIRHIPLVDGNLTMENGEIRANRNSFLGEQLNNLNQRAFVIYKQNFQNLQEDEINEMDITGHRDLENEIAFYNQMPQNPGLL